MLVLPLSPLLHKCLTFPRTMCSWDAVVKPPNHSVRILHSRVSLWPFLPALLIVNIMTVSRRGVAVE